MAARGDDCWIGIDGGATSVKGVAVLPRERGGRLYLEPMGEFLARPFPRDRAFQPLPLSVQLDRAAAGGATWATLSPAEREEAHRRVETYARTIADLARGCGRAQVRVALCGPGLRDSAGSGWLAVRNGPRHPRFLEDLAGVLARLGVEGVNGPSRIESDGTAATWGEAYGVQGSLRGVSNAYLVGCGTGLAESLVLDGRLLESRDFPAGWEVPWRGAPCAEERASITALVASWNRRGGDAEPGNGTIRDRASETAPVGATFPEEGARAGDARAWRVLSVWARELGRFLGERTVWLAARGWPLERVVVAQRGGALLADPRLSAGLVRELEGGLFETLNGARVGGSELEAPAWGRWLTASTLRGAPALGAVARELAWPDRVA